MPIEVDGSILEGGGQILRTAIAFSAVLQEPVRITKIRAKRDNPGLRPQHLHGIMGLQELTKAEVKGAHVGSREILFRPKNRQGGRIFVNIGTAGAISLVLHAVLIVVPFCQNPVEAKITGGTNVRWSPPIDYLQYVLLPRLSQMGLTGTVEIERRGYYPRGGGHVNASFSPISYLTSLNLELAESRPTIAGISHSGSLPKHVVSRQAKSVIKSLNEAGYSKIKIQQEHHPQTASPGSGVSLWTCEDSNQIIGSDALGRRGLRAEIVGANAADALLRELETKAPVDRHQADMLIPFTALAKGGSSFPISELTMHTMTNIHIVEQFLEVKFNITGELGSPAHISVKGVGFER